MTTATELKLAAALRELLAISKTEDWSGSFRLDDALEDARTALESVKEPTDHSAMLRTMNLAEANWWFVENVSTDDPMRDTYYWLLRERNAEADTASDAYACDRIAEILSGNEWDSDTCSAVRDAVECTGRSVADFDEG